MKLQTKIFGPLAGLVALGGGLVGLIAQTAMSDIRHSFAELVARSEQDTISAMIADASDGALRQAAVFSRHPDVLAAYRQAHAGDIDDESSAASQAAREEIRRRLAPLLRGFKESVGQDLALHFHLPNGRSLVRLWRERQAQRDGQWIDVSDDISDFRQTVLDVNQTGHAVGGIEPGRGGFAIRGVAPVVDEEGQRLGSVEVLGSFGDVVKKIAAKEGVEAIVLMNESLLGVTTKLRDPKQFPRLDDRWVVVAGQPSLPRVGALKQAGFELRGDARSVQLIDSTAALTFPLLDYRDRPIGAFMVLQSFEQSEAVLASARTATLGAAVIVLLGAFAVFAFSFRRTVLSPIERSVELAEAIDRKSVV